jgi:hypothetical protein
MLVAEHASTGTAAASTPSRFGARNRLGKRPTRGDSPSIDTYEQQAADYATLEGKDAHEHPDAIQRTGSVEPRR